MVNKEELIKLLDNSLQLLKLSLEKIYKVVLRQQKNTRYRIVRNIVDFSKSINEKRERERLPGQ